MGIEYDIESIKSWMEVINHNLSLINKKLDKLIDNKSEKEKEKEIIKNTLKDWGFNLNLKGKK
jgi:alpha-mannosidase